jgi:hypothetical protein
MKFLLLVMAGLIAATMVACGGSTKVSPGELVSDTITSSDANDDDWKSKTYEIEVKAGVVYSFELTTANGNIVGIWNSDADDYIVEVSPVVTRRTVNYVFSDDGTEKLYLQSPDSHVPSPFTFRVSIP